MSCSCIRMRSCGQDAVMQSQTGTVQYMRSLLRRRDACALTSARAAALLCNQQPAQPWFLGICGHFVQLCRRCQCPCGKHTHIHTHLMPKQAPECAAWVALAQGGLSTCCQETHQIMGSQSTNAQFNASVDPDLHGLNIRAVTRSHTAEVRKCPGRHCRHRSTHSSHAEVHRPCSIRVTCQAP